MGPVVQPTFSNAFLLMKIFIFCFIFDFTEVCSLRFNFSGDSMRLIKLSVEIQFRWRGLIDCAASQSEVGLENARPCPAVYTLNVGHNINVRYALLNRNWPYYNTMVDAGNIKIKYDS